MFYCLSPTLSAGKKEGQKVCYEYPLTCNTKKLLNMHHGITEHVDYGTVP